MTKMLVNFNSFNNINDLACDIASFPYDMAEQLVADMALADRPESLAFLLSMTLDDYINDFARDSVSQKEVLRFFDFIKLELPFSTLNDTFNQIEKLAREKQLIVQIGDFEKLTDLLTLLPRLASSGIYGVMLAPNTRMDKLNGQFSIVEMGVFIEQAHKNGLSACLTGGIEAPDIPRLLPFAPDILCFNTAQFLSNGTFDKQQGDLIRSLIPREKEDIVYNDSVGLGTDRILVNNFILPMAIGAYNHERNRLQKVRFSVKADVLRLSVNPEDMRHIFSYDLIIDGIRRLAQLGHVDLVETLAERIAAFILSYPRVQRVIVRVEKLELEPESVGIEIERVKKSH
ncbi:dihydroneopterin aldolase [Bartonella sp. HY329]|uniref:dihydroneopterin aldolase n=1 Tax=unclassified Bartonella TaxID=2645622 RepID=UPI0021C7AFB8|nr:MULTISPECIES: dihydroneopterin aldolase [unclassified Bartonella]UXM94355.1 dihydroneopterin aldolase [Bartonella sp. HY329]UXN08678.1 dihydroneopterin aldolase [Bartonella sp. HY328]